MNKIKAIIASVLLFGMSAQTVKVQDFISLDDQLYPYDFITLQSSGQLIVTDYKAFKLPTPIGSFSNGGMFTPTVDVCLNVNG